MITILLCYAAIKTSAGLTGTWKYRAFDAHQHLAAEGKIALHTNPPQGATAYAGTKSILQILPVSKVGPHGGHGPIVATLSGVSVSVNLNANMVDNNILLKGTLSGTHIVGTWGHSTIAGIRQKGAFTLAR
jgi:hypothetical protein